MTVLAAGSTKYLLTDTEAVQRNLLRREGRTEPTGVVVEVDCEEVVGIFRVDDIRVNGPVEFRNAHKKPLLTRHGERIYAAFVTTAEVVIGESCAPERAVRTPDTTKATPPARPAKPQRVTNVNTKE